MTRVQILIASLRSQEILIRSDNVTQLWRMREVKKIKQLLIEEMNNETTILQDDSTKELSATVIINYAA
jgi:hypothetical protein